MEKYLGKIKIEAFKQQSFDIHYCNSLILASHHREMDVVRANCCHHRFYNTCNELQASIRSKLITLHALPQILENHRLIMLTLTVQNCQAEDLHNTITVMHKAFKYLMDTRGENGLKERFDVPELFSWIRTTEVEGYIVDIRVACDGLEKEEVERSIREVVKGLKPKASKNTKERAQEAIKYLNKGGVGSAEQLRKIPEIFLMQVMEQLKGLRLVAYTGIFQPKDTFEPFDVPESVESARFDDSVFKNVPTLKRDEDNKMSLDEHLDVYVPVEQCMADHTEQKHTND